MDLFWIQWPILGSSGHFWREHDDDFDSHVTRKWHHLLKMIDFGQRPDYRRKNPFGQISWRHHFVLREKLRVLNRGLKCGYSWIDSHEGKKSWMHTNPNICHLWHTSNRCTILDINLYSGYPHKSKQIKIFQKFTTFKKFEKQPILSVILDWPISRRFFTLMLIGQRFQPNRTSAQVR